MSGDYVRYFTLTLEDLVQCSIKTLFLHDDDDDDNDNVDEQFKTFFPIESN